MDRDPNAAVPSATKRPRLRIETRGYVMEKGNRTGHSWTWYPKMPSPRFDVNLDEFQLCRGKDQWTKKSPPPSDASCEQDTKETQQSLAHQERWELEVARHVAAGIAEGDALIKAAGLPPLTAYEFMKHPRPTSPNIKHLCDDDCNGRRNSDPGPLEFADYLPRSDSAPPCIGALGHCQHDHRKGDLRAVRTPDYIEFLANQPEITVKHERDDVYISVKYFKPQKSEPIHIHIE